ncbi:MAG: RagB/SusD family nutrient uptake outer membrane protein [Prevotella sp.]|nr:RagB/SusD family nutrient uptake outer membrane protein [Prevotella sp.]
MKKIIRLSALLASALVITLGSASCDFLNVADDYFTDEISSDSIFTNKRNLEAYMWDISRMFPDEGLLQINPHTPGIYATDEAFSLVNMSQAYDGMAFVLGLVTPTNMRGFLSYYNRNYMAIRRCNDILANINKPQDMKATERALDLGYVHFFRAYAYYRLLLDFGPGINVGDEVLDPNGSTSYYSRPRSTYDEMEEYICNEFEEAARYLPARQSIMNFGRPTKGAAYGMIARLRTYWASPEFNGGEAAHRYFGNWKRSTDGAYYVNQNYDENRWAIAAAACKRVMDMTDGGNPMYKLHTVQASSETPALAPGVTTDPDYYKPWPQGAAGIDPYHSYADMFNGESVIPSNKEWVWARYSGSLTSDQQCAFPIKNGGWNNECVTQKVIDNYRMADGRTIDNSSSTCPYSEEGFTSQQRTFSGYRLNSGVFNMYNNREMRFYASIGFSECYWPMTSATSAGDHDLTVTYYYDSPNGKQQSDHDYPITGYVCKKFIHPSDAWQGTNSRRMDKAYPMIRYADILLMYVEALNHLTTTHTVTLGEQTYTLSRDVNEMQKYFGQVRHRAGLPAPSIDELSDEAYTQKLIQQERMSEFLFEGERYFDVRRWGIYEEEDSKPITGMNIEGTKDTYYRRVVPNTARVAQRVVSRKMVFLPIPDSEIRKVKDMDQNPGW